MEKRTNILKIRLTDAELEALRTASDRDHLATWLRDLGMAAAIPHSPKAKAPRAPRPAAIDREWLRELAQIGGNINQLARKVNGEARAGTLSAGLVAGVIGALHRMQDTLDQLRQTVTRHDR